MSKHADEFRAQGFHIWTVRGKIHVNSSAKNVSARQSAKYLLHCSLLPRNNCGGWTVACRDRETPLIRLQQFLCLLKRKIHQGHRSLAAYLFQDPTAQANDSRGLFQAQRPRDMGSSYLSHAMPNYCCWLDPP